MARALGEYLRSLRQKRGVGLKGAGPGLGLSYTYLSKLETGTTDPSEETMRKLALYYEVDVRVLEILSGRIPSDLVSEVESEPEAVVKLLREYFGG